MDEQRCPNKSSGPDAPPRHQEGGDATTSQEEARLLPWMPKWGVGSYRGSRGSYLRLTQPRAALDKPADCSLLLLLHFSLNNSHREIQNKGNSYHSGDIWEINYRQASSQLLLHFGQYMKVFLSLDWSLSLNSKSSITSHFGIQVVDNGS